MMANFVVSFDGSFLKYSARSWLSPYSLGAGAGAMLKKTENRGAECWCWCWRWQWPPVTTGWKESCSLMQLLSPGYWPSDNTATAVARCSVARCCTQVLGPGEDVPSDGHLWPDPLRGHAPRLRVPAAAARLREVLRARHHRHRRHRHRDQGQQRRVQSSAVRV